MIKANFFRTACHIENTFNQPLSYANIELRDNMSTTQLYSIGSKVFFEIKPKVKSSFKMKGELYNDDSPNAIMQINDN